MIASPVFARNFAVINCDSQSLTVLQADAPGFSIKIGSGCADALQVITALNFSVISTHVINTSIFYTLSETPPNTLTPVPAF